MLQAQRSGQVAKRPAPSSSHAKAAQPKRARLQNSLLQEIPAWTEKALSQLANLGKRKDAVWFKAPVVTDDLPDYHAIINRPMDLRTVGQQLRAGEYDSPADFSAVRCPLCVLCALQVA